MIEGFIAFLSMVYAATFSPNGYTYAQGEWAGIITEVENRGYLWKTWEGKMRTDPHPNLKYIRLSKMLECSQEKEFSIEGDEIRQELLQAMRNRSIVILHYERIGYFMSYWHGETRVFVKKIYPLKEKE
jgi:hypothetical protein